MFLDDVIPKTKSVPHYKLEEIRALIRESHYKDLELGYARQYNDDRTSQTLKQILHILGPEDISKLWNRI